MEVDLPSDHLAKPAVEPVQAVKPDATSSSEPMAFDSWAARPAPRRSVLPSRDRFDLGALKIFLILAGLTAGMAFALRSLF